MLVGPHLDGIPYPSLRSTIPTMRGPALATCSFMLAVLPAQEAGPASQHLFGRVLDSARRPVVGAGIELRRYPLFGFNGLDVANRRVPRRILETTTDEEGRFATELPIGLPFELHVVTEHSAREIRPAVYAGESVEIALRRGSFLEGHVTRDGDKSPVVGARLRGWTTASSIEILHGETDDAGSFRFEHLVPEAMTLEVLAPGLANPAWQRLTLAPGRTLRCELTARDASVLHGRVIDARTRRPIAGAEVAPSWTFKEFVSSDADGDYELRGVEYDEVYVRAAGYGRQGHKVVLGDRPLELGFELEPGRRVTGTIVVATGQPVAGVYVAAMASERVGDQQQTDWCAMFTGPDGRFELDSVRRDIPHSLVVRGDGFGTLIYDVPEDEAQRDAMDFGAIRVEPAVYLTGRVLDEHGGSIPDANVSLRGWNADRFRFLTSEAARRRQASQPKQRGSFYVNVRSTRSDTLGRYHFADVAPGNFSIGAVVEEVTPRVVGSSVVEAPGQTVEVERGSERLEHDFTIELGRVIRGRVLLPSGGVPPAVTVTLAPDGAATVEPVKRLFLRTGLPFSLFQLPEGTFAITVSPADELPGVAAGGPGADPKPCESTRRAVRATGELVWTALAEPLWIQAFVCDEDGRPMPGVRVAAIGGDGNVVTAGTSDHRGNVALRVDRERVVSLAVTTRRGATSTVLRSVEVGTANHVLTVRR